MPLLDGELVHRDLLQAVEVHLSQRAQQVRLVDPLDGLPVQIEVARGMLDRQHPAQPRHALRQPRGHPRVRLQPREPLQPGPAGRTCDAHPMHQQAGVGVEDRQITHFTRSCVVNRRARLPAAAANTRMSADRMQLDQHLGADPTVLPGLESADGSQRITFPPAQHGGNVLVRQRQPPAS